ncbi:hypothetical protein HMPREF9555_01973 [Selenomonas artemidis F0399]|uniref:Uncharacterized protein n=1 Tax=Selenomonas artemidis F0399 TaxID=749551 RepID=E7N4M4_9FIRM|nr:hypothetical protein HMPREF9555_01973 [Selenomonas artemidis F0399]
MDFSCSLFCLQTSASLTIRIKMMMLEFRAASASFVLRTKGIICGF